MKRIDDRRISDSKLPSGVGMKSSDAGPEQDHNPHISARLAQLGEETEPAFVKELVSQFLEQAPATMRRLNGAIQSRDKKATEVHAHKLKGGSANMGATVLAHLFEEVENAARKADMSSAGELMKNIDSEFRGVCHYLGAFLTKP
jgi:HPt (histidine-containing phosphotransfer) domain-containing protein